MEPKPAFVARWALERPCGTSVNKKRCGVGRKYAPWRKLHSMVDQPANRFQNAFKILTIVSRTNNVHPTSSPGLSRP